MKCHPSSQGFTRKELLVTLALAVVLVCFGINRWHSGGRIIIGSKVLTASKTGRDIHTMLSAWAADHNGEFPIAQQYSNEAFRELFRKGLIDTEKLFAIPGDAWHQNSPSGDGKGPDCETGTAPDYAQALMAGECAWAYITGLNGTSDPQLPLLANGFTESLGVYTADKTHKGGVFRGEKCAWVNVAGSGKVGLLSPDFHLREIKDGRKTDIFSKAWGTNPDNLKNPEG